MSQNEGLNFTGAVVGVVGAGPAGIYAARKLAQAGVHVVLLNRDLKPGGLAEYGIYFTKEKMKKGLRKQFQRILELPNVDYFGGVQIGEQAPIRIGDLEEVGFSALLFTVGAQGARKLGLPGEDGAKGIFHAKDIVYHYNKLPPHSQREFAIGKRVGIVGMGNVMVDIAHWLICEKKVEEVIVLARRGPAERAYTDKEMRAIARAIDWSEMKKEFARIEPRLLEVGQDPEQLYQELRAPLAKAVEIDSPTRFYFRFLSSPKQIMVDEESRVRAVEVEYNRLAPKEGVLRPHGTGEKSEIELDTLIYAIGDQVDPELGLPFEWGKYIVAPGPNPRDPEKPRYEVYDPEKKELLAGKFLGGWARVASDGLVGKARADGEAAAEELLAYLQDKATATPNTSPAEVRDKLLELLHKHELPIFTARETALLAECEKAEAARRGLPFFKYDTNAEMLAAVAEAAKSA